VLQVYRDLKEELMNRKEAIALLSELSANQFLNPNLVLLEKKEPERYSLQIRGDYSRKLIEAFLRKRHLSFEMSNDYLIVFKQ
jgi:hypothetical protein